MQKTLSNEKKMNAIVMKILLQINAKRGGELWAATTSIKNLMVAGIDVFHDPDNKGCSIAGFVSSLNPSYSKWVSHTCRQVTMNAGSMIMRGASTITYSLSISSAPSRSWWIRCALRS